MNSSDYSDASSEYSDNYSNYSEDFSDIPDNCDNCSVLCAQPYDTRYGFLCKGCVSKCNECDLYVLKGHDYCHYCEYNRQAFKKHVLMLKRKLLYGTKNNLTKKLPVELVNQIMSFLM